MTQPEELTQILLSKGITSPAEIQGCTDEDISQLEAAYKLKFPATYKQFLRVMGRGAGRLFADCSWTLPELAHANIMLQQKLLANNAVQVPKSAFVFLACSAAEILFFDAADGDDPPIYVVEIASEPPRLLSDSFSDWLSKAAKVAAKLSPNFM